MGRMRFRSSQILHNYAMASIASMPVFLFFALCLGACRSASAQTDVGYILGTVTDQTGAIVKGAQVTITQQGTGLQRTATTNDDGFYTSPPLQVGQYSVSVATTGFAPATIRDITVDAASHVQTNVVLHLGEATANVTVESAPPVMDTTDAQLASTIDARAAQQLPVNGRSVLALAAFTPGVVSAVGAVTEGFANRGNQISEISIAGGPNGYNNNILDGGSNVQDWLGEIAINLKSDAVQEFRIMSGAIPAQFGYTAGGVVNVVTRSGTNKIHGSIYEFFRNDALDAEQSYPRPVFGKQETRYNNYGGTLGGPIMHNKWFIFGNYEQYQYRSDSPGYNTVPTVQEYAGNFSDLGQLVNGVCKPINIYDDSNIAGGQRQQFNYNGIPNNIDPARLDPVALAYDKMFYPLPNNSTGSYNSCTHANNYLNALKAIQGERQGIVRTDYKLNASDSIVARYAYYLATTNNGTSTTGFSPAYSDRNDHLQNQTGVLSETHIFSTNLLNDVRVAFMRNDFPTMPGLLNQGVAQAIGLPNDSPSEIPNMSNGVTNTNDSHGFRTSTTIEGIDDVTWILKAHTLHIGGSARFVEAFNFQPPGGTSGNFSFGASTTAQGNDTTIISGTGSSFASYLLGEVHTATQVVASGLAWRRVMFAGYVQDDWRATPRLTINAGLRWDYMSQAVEKHNGIENFDITQKNPANGYLGLIEYANTNRYGRNFVPENYRDYGPRIGFAYAVTSDNKTIVRGGAGIYYPTTANYPLDQASGNSLGYTTYTTSYSAPTANGIAFQLRNGFPYAPIQPMGAAGGQNAFLGQTAAYIPPVAKDPSAQELSLTVSRELPGNLVVDASYVGNHGNHFVLTTNGYNINTLAPQYYGMGTAALSASVSNPYAGIVPGSLGAATITEANLLKPFPYMSTVTIQSPRDASYWANHFELSVQRRVQHGLQIIGSYTFGKITDDGITGLSDPASVGTATGAAPQNWRNIPAEHSVDAIDVTHRLTIAGLYDLPFGRGHRLLSNPRIGRLVGGWQYNAILTMESGRPIGVTGANNQLATRPNLNPNVSLKVAHPSRASLYKTGYLEWFNPQAFVNPPDYTFGNVPRFFGNLFGPGTVNIDMSLFKTTHITEGTVFEFRIEAFNALNHDNLTMPGTSFSAGAPAVASNPYAEGGTNTSAGFGMITSGGGIRNVQLGAKIIF
jgi:hypothetical protein